MLVPFPIFLLEIRILEKKGFGMKTTGYIDIKGEDLDLVLAKMCS